jgi:hypothetical protein
MQRCPTNHVNAFLQDPSAELEPLDLNPRSKNGKDIIINPGILGHLLCIPKQVEKAPLLLRVHFVNFPNSLVPVCITLSSCSFVFLPATLSTALNAYPNAPGEAEEPDEDPDCVGGVEYEGW